MAADAQEARRWNGFSLFEVQALNALLNLHFDGTPVPEEYHLPLEHLSKHVERAIDRKQVQTTR